MVNMIFFLEYLELEIVDFYAIFLCKIYNEFSYFIEWNERSRY